MTTAQQSEDTTALAPRSALEVAEVKAQRQLSTFGEYSPAAIRLKNDIVTDQVEATKHLQSVIADGTFTLETARVCLAGERERLAKYKRKERPAIMRSEGKPFARTIMTQLWTDEKLWGPLVSDDHLHTGNLCYFAIFEGLESFLVDWLRAEIDQPFVPEKEHMWRGHLLGSMVLAHAALSIGHELDEAIRCMFRVETLRRRLTAEAPEDQRPATAYLSLRPSVSILTKQIMTGQFRHTDERLYNEFCSLATRYRSKSYTERLEKNYRQAAFSLYHPKSPDHRLALACLKENVAQATTPEDLKILRNMMGLSNISLKRFILRAAYLASRSTHHADATFIREQGLRLQQVSTALPYDRYKTVGI
ncbi:hypothetical protein CLAFUW4_13838 [Fulvia fulva]|uniref:Uncharacterized protein n=1 Tax=Passalora fulva TaxID=5499 RepID=A0A9Q8UVT7_PASFU|nr:uncharacterized protein CLAFUR5_13683 [Fulvia fulva]KAK4610231.1 hypothetical protein CLAFUR4_13841 [Fulvia fulva]KAK4610878.1 hypothetical protein CLAFUR0_13845 [Fulvia fulva]UJO24207.1 hypothetical protein CLAFUR5_13683 [Fulvia fulva]WPV21713.1 hypothetical protein CLAFUW4_13838 [Fulvia fulva]WPV36650.1 hypothetical protein CLAFUW7_13846 [Fulvia fulva]